MSEAKQEVQQEPQEKKQFAWQGISTDLASFTAFGVVTLSDGQRVNVQMTNRHGLDSNKMYADYKQYVLFLDMCAQDHNVEFWDGSRKENGNTPTKAPESTGNSTPPSNGNSGGSSGAKHDGRTPLSQAEVPAELVEINKDIFAADFDYILIKPDLDEKSVVEFWKDDLKYPVGAKINKWKHDTIKQKLATLEVADLDPSKPAKVRIAGVQYWTKGAEFTNQKGEKSNYKDFLLAKPIF